MEHFAHTLFRFFSAFSPSIHEKRNDFGVYLSFGRTKNSIKRAYFVHLDWPKNVSTNIKYKTSSFHLLFLVFEPIFNSLKIKKKKKCNGQTNFTIIVFVQNEFFSFPLPLPCLCVCIIYIVIRNRGVFLRCGKI